MKSIKRMLAALVVMLAAVPVYASTNLLEDVQTAITGKVSEVVTAAAIVIGVAVAFGLAIWGGKKLYKVLKGFGN